jgi:scyllo-inositol 2-dehydrogenase (NADP+)
MTVNVALIGYGLAGASFHAPFIAAEPRLKLRRVVTSRSEEVARALPGVAVSTDIDASIADHDVQLVVVATPNKTHGPLARDALLAGKHVVIDKPFAVDPTEGADLIALARDRGRMLTMFHNRRWDGDFLTVAKLVESGRLGEVALAEFRWDRFRPEIKPGWKEVPDAGTGLLPDLGSHMIDQAIRLFGYPDMIGGDVALQRPGTLIDDYFEVTLHYGARRVILSCSSLAMAPRPRFALHGPKGSFVKYGIDPQEAVLRAGGNPRDPGYGVDAPEDYGVLTDAAGRHPVPTERGDWSLFYKGVADAIVDGAPPPVDPAEALAGLSIIECVRRSARDGRLLRFSPPD